MLSFIVQYYFAASWRLRSVAVRFNNAPWWRCSPKFQNQVNLNELGRRGFPRDGPAMLVLSKESIGMQRNIADSRQILKTGKHRFNQAGK